MFMAVEAMDRMAQVALQVTIILVAPVLLWSGSTNDESINFNWRQPSLPNRGRWERLSSSFKFAVGRLRRQRDN
jgi:hypothetical protein